MKVFTIALLSCKILSFSTQLFENFHLIVSQNFLLSVTFLMSMVLKYTFFYFFAVVLLHKKLAQKCCFLQFSKLMVVLSRFYLLFNLDLVIMVFLKVIFIKGLLIYLRYYCFKGSILKLLRESSISDNFFASPIKKFTIKILISMIRECFTFNVLLSWYFDKMS